MKISEQGLTLIMQFEGYSEQAYRCPAGKLTIGYGHVLLPGEEYPNGIDKPEALKLLKNDVKMTEQGVTRLTAVPLSQGQFDALVSLAYNIGIHAFEKSTLLRLLSVRNYAGAGAQFARWDMAGGIKIEGLTRRRMAETMLFQQNSDFS